VKSVHLVNDQLEEIVQENLTSQLRVLS